MAGKMQLFNSPYAIGTLLILPAIEVAPHILGHALMHKTVAWIRTLITTLMAGTIFMSLPAAAKDNAEVIREISDIDVDKEHLRQAVASRTLTWLTGSSSNNDHISVGRLANFFGFVALRVSSGHSLKRSAVAKSTLAILTEPQIDALVTLVNAQKEPFERTQATRYAMNRALEGLLVGETISKDAFLALGAAYGASEAELGRVIGQGLGDVAQTLTADQHTKLAMIRSANLAGRGHESEHSNHKIRMSQEAKQELVNIAARFLSWTTGSKDFNDFEVVGKPSQHFGFVSLRMESNHGVRRGTVAKEVWNMLASDKQQMIDAAVDHNATTFDEFLAIRAQLMRTLETALAGDVIDVARVQELGAALGNVEASMTWAQAVAMLRVRDTMDEAQLNALLAIRAKYTVGTLDVPTKDPIERGRQLFAQCALCHQSTDQKAIAPDLFGIVGREIATDASFESYSPAMQSFAEANQTWSEDLLDRFLELPQSIVPGTFMGFDGLEAAEDRVALIAYLRTKQ